MNTIISRYKTLVIILPVILVSFITMYEQSVHETANPTAFKNGSSIPSSNTGDSSGDTLQPITLFLCGDVMTGRGIDQVLRYPVSPEIHESYMKDARGYVQIAERANGPIPYPVSDTYIWGYALDQLKIFTPDVKIINLETSITTSNDYWKGKGIHYRMNPRNIGCIAAAGIDVCVLANNHILDWGYAGLSETLETLGKAGIVNAGAGEYLQEAEAPAVINVNRKGRVLVFSCGMASAGVYPSWAATSSRAGVWFLPDLSANTVNLITERITRIKTKGDIVVFSIHWGGNWGYEIPHEHMRFARDLIDMAGVDIIHGHSSHHVTGIEVYKEKLILYGCGDFLNDYEGIGGKETFRPDLALMYFAKMDPTSGKLKDLVLSPVQIRNFRLNKVSKADAQWLTRLLNWEALQPDNNFKLTSGNLIMMDWSK